MHLIALDPSSSVTGWAEFIDGRWAGAGYIVTAGDEWVGLLADGLADMLNAGARGRPDKILIEDISNRSNFGQYFGPKLFQWAKAVGVAFAVCRNYAPVVGYPSDWLQRKPYSKSKTAKQKNFRVRCAQAIYRQTTEVNQATAVLFGDWWLRKQGMLLTMLPNMPDAAARNIPPTGAKPRPQQPVAVAAPQARPGRRLKSHAEGVKP